MTTTTMGKITLEQAARKWVGEFAAIPQGLILKAYPDFCDEVEILSTELACTYCGCTQYTAEGSEDGKEDILTCMSCGNNEFGNSYGLPMWGTMWTFIDSSDEWWAMENLDAMRECGIWVYQSEELGIFFGIDGAGYDFYEQHWIPLYQKRGLQWHSVEN